MPIPSFMRMRLMPVPGLCACARPSAVTVFVDRFGFYFEAILPLDHAIVLCSIFKTVIITDFHFFKN